MVNGGAATVVWLAEGSPARPVSPADDARRALEAWARAHGVRLRAPSEDRPAALKIDWGAGEEVERDLGLARDALAGLDFDDTERELARAEAQLRDHPELPQAAWLRAEVERAWSARWLREGDDARARRAWQRGALLDGGRAPGLTERAFEPGASVTATIALDGSGALRLDGVSIAPGAVTVGEGEHALTIARADGAITWAGWVAIAEEARVRVAAPDTPACSREDVERARTAGGGPETVTGRAVVCKRWIAAVAQGNGGIRVARCEEGSCAPFAEWRALEPLKEKPSAARAVSAENRPAWPAWATWTLAGIGVAGATVAIIAAVGAFKQAPTDVHFVNGGLRIHAF